MKRRYWHQWLESITTHPRDFWIPLAIGAIATVAVLLLWRQLSIHEQLQIEQLVQQEADATQAILNRELSSRIVNLTQMAKRWESTGGTPRPLWEADASNVLRDAYGYRAIEWVDPSFQVRWIVPREGNEAAQNFNLNREPRRRVSLRIARDLRQVLLTRKVSLVQGGEGFLAVAPLFITGETAESGGDRFDGFIVGVFEFQALFDGLLQISPRYKVRIYDRGELVYTQGTSSFSPFQKTATVRAYNADWLVRIYPTSAWIDGARSPLPQVVLWGGIVMAWMLALSVYLGLRSRRYARTTRAINRQLAKEIRQRKKVEATLREREELFRQLSKCAPVGIFLTDENGACTYVNDRWCELTGLTSEQASGEGWKSALHPDDYSATFAEWNAAVRENREFAMEYRFRHADGAIVWVAGQATALKNDDDINIGFIGIVADITALKVTEAALRNSRRQYQTLVENSPDIIERFDTEFKHLYVSPALTRLTGISAEVFLGKSCRELGLSEAMVNTWEAAVSRLLETGQRQIVEFETETLNGLRSFEMAIAPEMMEDGAIASVLCISRDVTERKRTQISLQNSRAKFQALVANMPGMVYRFFPATADKPPHFAFVSSRVRDIFELEPERVIEDAHAIINLIHPEDLPAYHSANVEAIENFSPWHWEGRIVTPSGQVKWIDSCAQPQITPAGNAWDGIILDISDRKEHEESLRQFQSIVSTTAEGIALIDRHYIYQIVNQTYSNLTGKRDGEIIGHSIAEVLGDRIFNNIVKSRFDLCLAGQIVRYDSWLTFDRSKKYFVGATYTPIFKPDGTVGAAIVNIRDLTSLKQAEIAIRQQSEREHLLSAITNRIRRSLDLQEILDTAVAEVCKVLSTDQVAIYRFNGDWSGEFIAVSSPISGEISGSDAVTMAVAPAVECDIRQVADSCRNRSSDGSFNIDWQQFQTRTHLIFPIWVEVEQLWGLLIARHSPKAQYWISEEIQMFKRLTEQLAIAIQQAELYHRIQMAHRELERLYNTDPLTEIANRRHFDRRLQQEWLRLQREGQPFTIIMCDIDYFKCYNDTYGHVAGDQCLRRVARALKGCLKRPADLIARYGGEEFVVLLPNTSESGGIQIARQMQRAIFNLNIPPGSIPTDSTRVSISLGIATEIPSQRRSPIQLLSRADRALYEAKKRGRNQFLIDN